MTWRGKKDKECASTGEKTLYRAKWRHSEVNVKKKSSGQSWSSHPVSGTWAAECQDPTFLVFLTAAVRMKTAMRTFPLTSVTAVFPGLSTSLAQADESSRLLQPLWVTKLLPGIPSYFLSQLNSLMFSRPLEGPGYLRLTPCTWSYRSWTEGFSLW